MLNPDGSATFGDASLTYAGVTTVVALPVGVISPTPTPKLESTQSGLGIPFWVMVALGAVELVVLCGGIIAFVVVRGRDRQSAGSAVDQAFAGAESGEGERVPMFANREIPVQFEPPDKLRPGLLGVLVDEQATPLDVTATIIDLACRGYLRLVEVEPTGLVFKQPDWRIDRMRPDVDGLEPYEVTLIDELFAGNVNSVVLSDLKNTFAAKMKLIKRSLISGAMKRGWFRRDPSASATSAKTLAGVMLAVGVFGSFTCFLAPLTIPLAIAGLLLFFLARYLPARTPVGTATYRQALGFRRFIVESEKYRAQFAERANLFTEYLPYAVVFGAATKWAKTFADLGLQPSESPSWYYSQNAFNVVAFSTALTSFATTSVCTLTSTPGASGGSGFSGGGGSSGGGGGGGGGGGW